MVEPNNYNTKYNEKIKKYKKLTEILRQEKHVKKRTTICYHHNRWFDQQILSEQTSKTQYQNRIGANNQENDYK